MAEEEIIRQFTVSLIERNLPNYEGTCWLEIIEAFIAEHRDRVAKNAVFYLEGPSGQSWDVQIEQGDSVKQLGFKEGWRQFAYDHKLELGDSLSFLLHERESRFIVDVFDEYGVPKQTALCAVHNGLPSGLRDIPSPTKEAFLANKKAQVISAAKEAAEAFAAASDSPTYMIQMGPRSIVRSSLYINTQCSKTWMPKAQYKTVTVVDTHGKEWPMFWSKVSGDTFGLGTGWKDFALHHRVKIGDVCLLELVEVDKRLRIYVFRDKEATEDIGEGEEKFQGEEKLQVSRKRKVDLEQLHLRHSKLYKTVLGRKTSLVADVEIPSFQRPFVKAPRSKRVCKRNISFTMGSFLGEEFEWQDFYKEEKRALIQTKGSSSQILAEQLSTNCTPAATLSCQTTVETVRSQSFNDLMSSSAGNEEVGQEPTTSNVVLTGDSELLSRPLKDSGIEKPLNESPDILGSTDGALRENQLSSACTLSAQGRKRSRKNCTPKRVPQMETEAPDLKESHILEKQKTSLDAQTGESLTEISRAMKAASGLATKNPSFTVCMSAGDWRSKLVLPHEFLRDRIKLESIALIILVDACDKHWGVTLRSLVQDGVPFLCLHEGWKSFVAAHALQEGDACVFELINADDITFQIHICRLAEVTKAPQLKIADSYHMEAKCDRDLNPALASKEKASMGLKITIPGACTTVHGRSKQESWSEPHSKVKRSRTGAAAQNFLYSLQKLRADRSRKEREAAGKRKTLT